MCFECSKLQIKKYLKKKKKPSKVSIKTRFRKLEGETLPKWFFIYKQLEKCQNEYYSDNINLINF